MFESTPVIILTVIVLSAIIGGIIGNILSKGGVEYEEDKDSESKHTFHVDRATGIVSDSTPLKYNR
jgi:hypothetical protein